MIPDVVSFEKFSRALVVKLRHHGDVLLASPVFAALKRAAPRCEIDALVYGETRPMLEGHPDISEIHAIDRGWKQLSPLARLAAEGRLLSALHKRRYDLVIHLSVHRRGAWLARLLRPGVSVAPRHRGRFWARSFTHFYPSQSHPDRHTVETNLDSLRALGLEPSREDKRVVLVPGDAALARVDALLSEYRLSPGGFILIHPASRWLFKCWPADKVATLADALARHGFPIVLAAAPDAREQAMIATVRKIMKSPAIDLSGRLSLKDLAALTAEARLFVGVDSAPMHIAAAMGTPPVALFGPSGDREWGPWNVAHRVVANDRACRPCGRDGCDGGKVSECLTTLPVAHVLAACEEFIVQ